MDRSVPRLALIGLGVAVLVVVLVTGATSTSSFGTHNPSWDGTADLRSIAEERSTMTILRNVTAYDEMSGNGTLAIVLSPAEPYGEDVAAVQRFLDRGGTVLIAEDYRPHSNALLSAVGASARFDGTPLRDERNYERSPRFVQASVATDRSLAGGVETLVLNRGTVLDAGAATVVARTSRDAYLDENRNDALDDAETPAERPVMAVESVGEGRVITIADPSVFINSMLAYGDNRAFATELVERHDRVLLDVSHSPGIPPLMAVVLTVRDSLLLQLVVGTVLVVGVAGRHRVIDGVRRVRHRRSRRVEGSPTDPVDPDAVVRAVTREHPSWNESRVERVAKEMVADRRFDGATNDGSRVERTSVEPPSVGGSDADPGDDRP